MKPWSQGAGRLLFGAAAVSAAALSVPSVRNAASWPGLPTDTANGQGAIETAIRDFLGGKTPPPAPAKEAEFFGQESAAPLTAYAPDASLKPTVEPDPAPLGAAQLLGADAEPFARALAAYKSGDFAAGDAAAAEMPAALPATAAQWAGLRLHPREAGLTRIAKFLAAHPDWPAADWLRKRAEESLFGDRHSNKAVKAYFAEGKPVTPAGKLALARVLASEGDFAGAGALAKQVWRDDDINESLENAVKKEFGELLTARDHKRRADRLLYADKNAAALRAAELAGKDMVLLARARAAANHDAGSDALFNLAPPALQNDPGLLLARVHTFRKHDKIAEAGALLLTAPRDPDSVIDGDAWWTERRLVARKLLDRGDAASAYKICADHSARTPNARVEAEFHAGWIALRFLGDAAAAARHFELLAQAADTPIQLSRAAYWQGRAAEALGSPETNSAPAHYEVAAAYSTTFYGQMARLRIGGADEPLRPAPAAAQGDARDESVRAVELLFAAGEREVAAPLASDAAKRLKGDAQLAALGEVAARHRDAKIALTLGKLIAHRGVALDHVAFPSYGVPSFGALPGSAPRSIVYAIARQESAFDARAISSAGAMGLMQMIASTARHTAYQTGVSFDLSRMLSEPAFNAQLGAAHLGILLGEYKGSNLLTFAAYNAGGGRVKQWIDAYGDPRRKEVDPIDWVERIPIAETRNYVQRVMENYVVYRAKFGNDGMRAPQIELAHAGL